MSPLATLAPLRTPSTPRGGFSAAPTDRRLDLPGQLVVRRNLVAGDRRYLALGKTSSREDLPHDLVLGLTVIIDVRGQETSLLLDRPVFVAQGLVGSQYVAYAEV